MNTGIKIYMNHFPYTRLTPKSFFTVILELLLAEQRPVRRYSLPRVPDYFYYVRIFKYERASAREFHHSCG